MKKKRPIVALLYDFDKTLCTKDMQEYTFIPSIKMTAEEFWHEANTLAKQEQMDRILAYMYLMIRKCRSADVSIQKKSFIALGKDVEFFPGVLDWFSRINQFGEKQGVEIQHYIISSGLKEIIQGSAIAKEFKEIFACQFHYNVDNIADWPLMVVNYTTKTQYLFRINKGALDMSDDRTVNEYSEKELRPIPFRNMIYIGDGFTDVPCMKLVYVNGGKSIAVYDDDKKTAEDLLEQERIHYVAKADYREGSELEELIQHCIVQMAETSFLVEKSRKQKDELKKKRTRE